MNNLKNINSEVLDLSIVKEQRLIIVQTVTNKVTKISSKVILLAITLIFLNFVV